MDHIFLKQSYLCLLKFNLCQDFCLWFPRVLALCHFCFSCVAFFLPENKTSVLICLLHVFNDGNGPECVGLVVEFMLFSYLFFMT